MHTIMNSRSFKYNTNSVYIVCFIKSIKISGTQL